MPSDLCNPYIHSATALCDIHHINIAVLQILVSPHLDTSKVCTPRPTKVSCSSTYVIDLSKLAHPDDVKNDNFGVWSHSGSHPQTFRVHIETDGYMRVEKCAAGATGNDVVYVRRLHNVHRSNKQFKCMIAFVSGEYFSLNAQLSYQ